MKRHSIHTLTALLLAGLAGAQGGDTCSNPTPIQGVGLFPFDNQSANLDPPFFCMPRLHDVWFLWSPTAAGNYVVSTCGQTNIDTRLAVFAPGQCSPTIMVACNDDACGTQSSVALTAGANSSFLIMLASAGSSVGGTGHVEITAGGAGTTSCGYQPVGADLIVGSIFGASRSPSVGGIAAYMFGTDICNVGTQEALYQVSTIDHPVFTHNVYRLNEGRFEHLGQSWAAHGFSALQQSLCCSCQSSGTGQRLGVGCSDPTGGVLHANQAALGPRSEVNATTGAFPYPHGAFGMTGDSIYKRAQVAESDILAANFPQASYVAEVQVVSLDDATPGNGANNAAWIPLYRGGLDLTPVTATRRGQPALWAWVEADPSVAMRPVDVPGDGRYWVASNCYQDPSGFYRYEYCVFNLNSHRSVGSFSVPVGAGAVVGTAGMSFPPSHSGEPTSNAPWTAQVLADRVVWSTDTFGVDPNANAVRWGTTYSFWFTSSSPPEVKASTLGLFRPGPQADPTVDVCGPIAGVAGPIVSNYCTASPNSTGLVGVIAAQNFDLVGRTMELAATNLPSSSFAYSLASETPGFVANPGGSSGNLCVTGNIGRRVGGSILNTGPSGNLLESVDLDVIPQPTGTVTVLAGATWYFQFWHRDTIPGLGFATSNFTDGVRVIFP